MRRRMVALALLAGLRAAAQTRAPELVLKSTSRVVQLQVSVTDPSGRPVHGLQRKDFAVTDDGHPRDLRVFAGEIDPAPELGVYSNRLGLRSSRIVTAIVIDAVLRPHDLQSNGGMFARWPPEVAQAFARAGARRAIYRMQPGQTVAIYAACPDLRLVQDYTNDPDRLLASLDAFVFSKKQVGSIDTMPPSMLAALRDVAAGMSGASGRKSIIWLSQAYSTELNPEALAGLTDSTSAAFNDANVTLYAVDTHFNPTCDPPSRFEIDSNLGRTVLLPRNCSQPWDISDQWMEYLAAATGGRAFAGGKVDAVQERDPQGHVTWGRYGLDRNDTATDAVLLAIGDSRYAYDMGFYVPDSELDGKFHMLSVAIPGKPKYALRYRNGYTASASVPAQAAPDLSPGGVGIEARVELPAKGSKELRVFLALDPATVTNLIFTQTDASGKQLARVEETMLAPSAQYTRSLKLANGAALLHVTVLDQATNRTGSLAIPIGRD